MSKKSQHPYLASDRKEIETLTMEFRLQASVITPATMIRLPPFSIDWRKTQHCRALWCEELTCRGDIRKNSRWTACQPSAVNFAYNKLSSFDTTVYNAVTDLTLDGNPIDDDGLATAIPWPPSPNLGRLRTPETKATNEGMKHLKKLSNLTSVGLNHTLVTDSGIAVLLDCPASCFFQRSTRMWSGL